MDIDLSRVIGISPQFSTYVVGERQLLLLSEQRSFRLIGRLYLALLPYLDGKRTGEEIIRAFSGAAPEERLRAALSNLFAKNYACYFDTKAPMEQQALWVELGLAPDSAEVNLARHKIAITAAGDVGTNVETARALATVASQIGLRLVADDEADILIVSVDDYLHHDLGAKNLELRRARRSWMPFKAGGTIPLIGPLFRPTGQPCWTCLGNRMMENRPGDLLVGEAAAAARPARAYNTATLGLATNFAALELARALAEENLAKLERHVLSLDFATRTYGEHLVRPLPGCPVCGEAYDAERELRRADKPLELTSRPIQPLVDGGWRVFPAAEVVRGLERYVSPLTGVISGLENCSLAEGLPVFRARQTHPVQITPRQNRRLGRPGGAAGKGMSAVQAKASCLAEAMERYLCGYTGREPRKRTTWAALGASAPHPHTCLNFSERQYDTREEWNKSNDGINQVPERFDEVRAIEWTPAWSLSHNERRWLPTRYCYFNYADVEEPVKRTDNAFCRADSNGCASGSTLEEAILQGFFELIERDACALWWYNQVRRPAFDLDAIEDPFVRRTRAHFAEVNRGLHVLDLTNDLGIPVAIAVGYKLNDGKSMMLGLGAHLDVRVAVSRAVAEMNQTLALAAQADAWPMQQANGEEAAIPSWLENHSLETDVYCAPNGVSDVGGHPRPPVGNLKEAVEFCMRAVTDRGHDMIVLDQSRPEIDFAAARVVIPGLRHFWARFREGRLYDAPVRLGWLDRPKIEDELNPIPFFM
ncbi:TOMM precursor leader peptide-binding protein [Rhizobium leguminosarum]|uniref:TOMM precursor leader peptide-binding protein n=1 Tax=Rhizobium leguminosarum TaxID=384 RepID=UPI0013EED48C|nr:TOMM precursor leader peptide-binding protein [Rhizobium leguminosarum]